jgi:hypothetical protein
MTHRQRERRAMETFELEQFLFEFDSEETIAGEALMETPPGFLEALIFTYVRLN